MNLNIVRGTTFTLFSTDLDTIIQKYYTGYYSNIRMPVLEGVTFTNVDVSLRPVNNDQFSIRSRSGTGNVIVLDNCVIESDTTRCNYCCRDFVVSGEPYKIITGFSSDGKPTGIDQFCHKRCAYAAAIETGNQEYINYTRNMYADDDEELIPANPWRLLKINGGCMTSDEWENPKYQYIKMPFTVIPVKTGYEKRTLK